MEVRSSQCGVSESPCLGSLMQCRVQQTRNPEKSIYVLAGSSLTSDLGQVTPSCVPDRLLLCSGRATPASDGAIRGPEWAPCMEGFCGVYKMNGRIIFILTLDVE